MYYNGKVKCIKGDEDFIEGKIYDVKDGFIKNPNHTNKTPFKTFSDLKSYFNGAWDSLSTVITFEEVTASGNVSVADIHSKICDNIKEVYAKKNADYGNSFAMAREEIPYYTLGKLYDKFSRYKNLTLNNNSANNESIEDTLLDMANYCIMELAEIEHARL